MANPPPPYDDITGISRTVMKDNAQESITNYNGNARPGEMVVDLTNNNVYIGNTNGNLTLISTGGGSGNSEPAGSVGAVQLNAGGNLFGASANLTFVNNTLTAGNVIPAADNIYFLGNATNRWANIWLGPGTLYITDSNVAANTTAELTVLNGVLQINGADQLQVGQLKFVDNTIESITGNIDIDIGLTESTANLVLNRNTVVTAGKTLTVGGNLTVSGNIVSGNIGNASTYLRGDGSNITGITGSYGNSNVSTYLASGTNSAGMVTNGRITTIGVTTGNVIMPPATTPSTGEINGWTSVPRAFGQGSNPAWLPFNGIVSTANSDWNVTIVESGILDTLSLSSQAFFAYAVGDVIRLPGTTFGAASPADDIVITVQTVTNGPATIDLTKSINKLSENSYNLPDGSEGQILYLVTQEGVTNRPTISIVVANARNVVTESTDVILIFSSDIITLLFIDGAWVQTGGTWL